MHGHYMYKANWMSSAPLLRVALTLILGIIFSGEVFLPFYLWLGMEGAVLFVLIAVKGKPLLSSSLLLVAVFLLGGLRTSLPSAPDRHGDTLYRSAMEMRERMQGEYQRLGLQGDQLAVVSAMTLGDKTLLTREVKQDFSVSSAAHVLALSGLHLSILYGALLMLFPHRRYPLVTELILLSTIWAYVLIVGMAPSIVRAATMISVCSLASLGHRKAFSVNTLSFAALVMLIANPTNLWDVGFQMSFMAVLSILLFYQPLYQLLHPYHPLFKWLWGMIAVTISAQIGIIPIVMYYFHRFSCYFLLTNMLVVPVATLMIYLSLLLLMTAPWSTLQQWVADVLNGVSNLMDTMVSGIAGLPNASIEEIHISLPQLFLIYVFLLSTTLWIYKKTGVVD